MAIYGHSDSMRPGIFILKHTRYSSALSVLGMSILRCTCPHHDNSTTETEQPPIHSYMPNTHSSEL